MGIFSDAISWLFRRWRIASDDFLGETRVPALVFKDRKMERGFQNHQVLRKFFSQVVLGVVEFVGSCVFIALDFANYPRHAVSLIPIRIGLFLAPPFLWTVLRCVMQRKPSTHHLVARVLTPATTLVVLAFVGGLVAIDCVTEGPALGFGAMLCMYAMTAPCAVVGVFPFFAALITCVLSVALYDSLMSWQHFVLREVFLTNQVVFVTTVFTGLAAVYSAEIDERDQWLRLRALFRLVGRANVPAMLKNLSQGVLPHQHVKENPKIFLAPPEPAIKVAGGEAAPTPPAPVLSHPSLQSLEDECKTFEELETNIWKYSVPRGTARCGCTPVTSAWEWAFQWWRNEVLTGATRINAIFTATYFCLIIVMDVLLHTDKVLVLCSIRAGMAVICLGFLAVTFLSWGRKHLHVVSFVFYLLNSAATISIVMIVDARHDIIKQRPYSTGVFRLTMQALGGLRLPLWMGILGSCISTVTYDTLIVARGYSSATIFSEILFSISFLAIGVVYSRTRESRLRVKFAATLETMRVERALKELRYSSAPSTSPAVVCVEQPPVGSAHSRNALCPDRPPGGPDAVLKQMSSEDLPVTHRPSAFEVEGGPSVAALDQPTADSIAAAFSRDDISLCTLAASMNR